MPECTGLGPFVGALLASRRKEVVWVFCAGLAPFGMKWDEKKSFSHVTVCCWNERSGVCGVWCGECVYVQCSAVQCCGVSCRVVSLFVCRHRCVSCVVKKTRSHVHDGSKKKKKISEIVHKLPRKGFISIAVLKNSKTIHPQKLRLLQFQSHHVSSVISSAWMVELPVTAPLHHRPTVPQPHHTAHTYLQHPFQDYLWPCSVRLHHPTSRCWSIPKNSRTSTSRRTHTYLVRFLRIRGCDAKTFCHDHCMLLPAIACCS